jgi:hypothetical protein
MIPVLGKKARGYRNLILMYLFILEGTIEKQIMFKGKRLTDMQRDKFVHFCINCKK